MRVELKPVPSQPGLFADEEGRIWSTRRAGRPSQKSFPPKQLKEYSDHDGYRCGANGRFARLVCEAFHGAAKGRQVNHINGIKSDDRPENLEWVTARENMLHAVRSGLVDPATVLQRPEVKARRMARLREVVQTPEWRRRNAEGQAKVDGHARSVKAYQTRRERGS